MPRPATRMATSTWSGTADGRTQATSAAAKAPTAANNAKNAKWVSSAATSTIPSTNHASATAAPSFHDHSTAGVRRSYRRSPVDLVAAPVVLGLDLERGVAEPVALLEEHTGLVEHPMAVRPDPDHEVRRGHL